MLKSFHKYIFDPDYRFMIHTYHGITRFMSDKAYIRRYFHAQMGYDLDLDNPRTFNEKLQWLKLHDRKPIYTTMVDKYEAKRYAASIIGDEHIVPTFGIWDRFENVEFDSLPNQFVLKCTHDSGGLVICKDKASFNTDEAKRKINKSLKHNFYWEGREWPYKKVKPRIIAEEYLEDKSQVGLTDYKIHCFNGDPKVILVCKNRFSDAGMTEDFFDIDWIHLNVKREHNSNSKDEIEKPDNLDNMLKLAKELSKDIPFLRVDLYSVFNKLYLGELTFYPACGFQKFIPDSFDKKMGEWINLLELRSC